MAADDNDDDFEAEPGGDLEEVDLDVEELDEDLDEPFDSDADVVVDVVADVDVEEVPAPVRKKRDDDEDDDEDEVDPDDVEADLDTILKDRIAATDDEDDEEEEEAPATGAPEGTASVAPKRANEFTCPGCFLLVNRGQFGRPGQLQCPVGEDPCPAIQMIEADG